MAGRKRKYFTEEEKTESRRKINERFYDKHKEEVKKNNLKKYHENKKSKS